MSESALGKMREAEAVSVLVWNVGSLRLGIGTLIARDTEEVKAPDLELTRLFLKLRI